MWMIFVAVLAIGAVWANHRYRRTQRRNERFHASFPQSWLLILEKNVPLYQRLPAHLKEELQGLIQVFVDEKHFVGCGGLEIDNEIRVTIAAFASILLLNRQHQYYPGFTSIYVYPDATSSIQKNGTA